MNPPDLPPDRRAGLGGGFIQVEGEAGAAADAPRVPYAFDTAAGMLETCARHGLTIAEAARANERMQRDDAGIDAGLDRIWAAMRACVARGIAADDILGRRAGEAEDDRAIGTLADAGSAREPNRSHVTRSGGGRRSRPAPHSTNSRAARIGPTACELDGPMPKRNRSKTPTKTGGPGRPAHPRRPCAVRSPLTHHRLS